MYKIDPIEAKMSLDCSFNNNCMENAGKQLEEHRRRLEQEKRDDWLRWYQRTTLENMRASEKTGDQESLQI